MNTLTTVTVARAPLSAVANTVRTVRCPSCNGERTTKAPAHVRISCPHCGELYPAPPPAQVVADVQPSSDVAAPAVPPPPPAPPNPQPAPADPLVRPRAGATRVTQRSRPRARQPRDTKSGKFQKAAPSSITDPAPAPHPQAAAAKRSGARGGAAVYRKKVGRVGR